jgi:D-alanyl-D-alanine carboxypeptidase
MTGWGRLTGSLGPHGRPRPQRGHAARRLLVVSAATALAACSSATPSPADPGVTPSVASPAATAAASAAPTFAVSPSVTASTAPTVPPRPAGTPDARWAPPSDSALPSATTATLQTLIDGWVGTSGIPGMAAAVVTPDGSWAGAAGTDAAGTPIAPDSAFAIASVTKTFVAAEVLRLAADGRIDLDAPVATYVDLPFDTGGATIRQLATMRSGFPLFAPDATLVPLVAKDLTRLWTARDIVELSADQPRVGTLDGRGEYNGLNYVALAMVIEKVTGEPLATSLRRDLLAPAGLERVWMQPEEKPTAPLTVAVEPDAMQVVDPTSGYLPSLAAASTGRGGAGIAADAPSLARWGYLLYGGRVIDPSLVATMTAGDPDADNGYGFGTMTAEVDGTTFVGHAGDYMGYSAILLVWPTTKTAVAVLAPRQGVSVDGTLPDWAIRLYELVGG